MVRLNITKFQLGLKGQESAIVFLQAKGYKILETNYRTRAGEIDIIATFGNYIIFIEVKLRTGFSYGHPCEAVNTNKQGKIIKTALHYIADNCLNDKDFRFDVIELLQKDGQLYANHIIDAFGE